MPNATILSQGKTFRLSAFVIEDGRITVSIEDDISFDQSAIDLIESTLRKIKLQKPLLIRISIGDRTGYDRENHKIEFKKGSFFRETGNRLTVPNPSLFRKIFSQLIGASVWETHLTPKHRKAYTRLISSLPGSTEKKPPVPGKSTDLFKKNPIKDFGISFEKFWFGRLRSPRKSFIENFLTKVKKPWNPTNKPPVSEPRRIDNDRKMPIPSTPFTPSPNQYPSR